MVTDARIIPLHLNCWIFAIGLVCLYWTRTVLLSSSEDGLNDLSTLLYRDRNHPSIFMWSMENEEAIQGTVMGTRILESMVETTHRIDPTRPVTAAMNHGWNTGGYSDVLDVVGYNYGDKRSQYVNDHEKYPQRKMFVTECTSFVSTRGEYEINKEKGYVSNIGPYTPNWGPEPGKDWEQIVIISLSWAAHLYGQDSITEANQLPICGHVFLRISV